MWSGCVCVCSTHETTATGGVLRRALVRQNVCERGENLKYNFVDYVRAC